MGLRAGGSHVAIVVADGRSTDSDAVLETFMHTTYINFSAGVGVCVNKSELELIASERSLSFTIGNFDFAAIQELQDRISKELCVRQCKLMHDL